MRELMRKHPNDPSAIIREYAQAEREGVVQRERDTNDLSAEDYASRLYADGIKKQWIYDQP